MSLVMDFIHGAENVAKGIAQPIENIGEQDIVRPAETLAAQATGNQQKANQLNQQEFGSNATPSKEFGDVAQVGLDVAAPEIGGAVGDVTDGLLPEAASKAGKIVNSALKGGAEGAAIGGSQGVAQGATAGQKPNKLALDFIQGAGEGAAIGGTLGGGATAIANRTPLNQVGAAGSIKPSDQFSDEDLQKMTENNDPKGIAKQLEPVTGKAIAGQISPAVANATDPNIARNIIDNSVNSKLSPVQQVATPGATGMESQSPAPTSLPPPTPTSDINTPTQVEGEAQQAEANYSPQQTNLLPANTQSLGEPSLLAETSARQGQTAANREVELQNNATQYHQPKPETNINPEEASLYAKEPDAAFINAPGDNAPSQVGKLGVISEMSRMAGSGQFSNDEILDYYYKQTPSSTTTDAQDALDQAINSAGVDKSKINASVNPEANKIHIAPVKAGDDSAALLNGRYAGEKIGEVGQPAIQDMQDLDEHDRELTRYLRGKNPDEVEGIINQAHYPDTFRQYTVDAKKYLDTAQAQGAELGQQLPYRVNYGGRTPYDPPQGIPGVTKEAEAGNETPAGLPTNASYTKQRYFNTHEEALANGYTPINQDPLDDLKNDVNQRATNQTKLALAKGYDQAHPGAVRIANNPDAPIPAGYRQLLVPGGNSIYLPQDIADKINNQVMTKAPGSILGKYDTINQAGKELELGGGTFHGFNTIGTFVGQQLTSLKALTNPGALGQTVQNAFSDSAMDKYITENSDAELNPSGGVDENHSIVDGAKASGLNIKNTSVDLENPGEKNLAGKIANIPVLKQVHQAVFDRQIPTMMLETFKQKTQGLDIFGNADDREAAVKMAQQVNREFGVQDHDIDGLTKQQFKIAGRFVLAPGYQEGQIRTLVDAISKGGPEGTLARQAVFGKALVFGALATIGSAAGGDFKDMTPKQVALAIMNKAINPSFDIAGYKVSTPATQISNIAKPVEESIASAKAGKGIAAGPEDFASSHLAFLPSKAEEFGANKNYEGNPVYGKDYFGRPISAGQTAENAISGIAPIPLAQTAQTASGSQSTGAAIANTVGFNASPTGNTEYAPIAMQTYLQQLQKTPGVSKQELAADTSFAEALSQTGVSRTQTVDKAEAAYIAKDRPKMEAIMKTYNEALTKALQPWAQSGGSKFMTPYMLQLLRYQTISYKDVGENAQYNEETNPTAYGVPVAALAQAPATMNNENVSQLVNNTTATRV